ncbi:Ribosomal protein L24e [Fragilaria crotonensis]|nr:Ribosomal protein L24e [Fragilaria crotonensis]
MVIATELCALSEYRIYPGNGKLMIRRDGKPVFLGTSKSFSLTMQRKKGRQIVQRAVVGASLEEIKKKAAQKGDFRAAQRDAALKEVKQRKVANKAKSGKTATPKVAAAFQKVPKHMGGTGKRGTTQR